MPSTAVLRRSQVRAATAASPEVARPRLPSVGQDRRRGAEGVPAQRRAPRPGAGRLLGGRRERRTAGVEVGEPGGGVAEGDRGRGVEGAACGRGLADRRELGEAGDQGGGHQGRGAAMRLRRVRAAMWSRSCTGNAPAGVRGLRGTSGRDVALDRSRECGLPSSGASNPSIHRPSCPAPSRWPRWAISRATCAGPGTPRRRTSSGPSTPSSGSPTGRDPVRLLGAVGRARLAELAGDRRVPRDWLELARADLDDYLTGDRWYQHKRRRRGERRAPAAIAYFSPGVRHHRRAAAVLRRPRHPRRRPPQGRQRPRRAAHRRRPALPARLLPPVAVPRGLAAGAYPVLDPDGLPLIAAARGRRHARARSRSRCPAARALHARIWVAQVGRVPLLLLDSDVEENDPAERDVTDRLYGGGSEHRLLQEMLLGIGGVRAVRAYCRLTGAPGARGVPHQRGPRRLPRPRADPRAHRRRDGPGLDFDAALEVGRAPAPSSPPTPRCRPASTASPRELVAQHFGGDSADCPASRSSGSSRSAPRTIDGRRPERLQHGGDGPAARPARQRRLRAARRTSAAGCSPGSGRASTTTRCRSPRSPTACTRRPGWPARSSTCAATARRPTPSPTATRASGTSSTRSPTPTSGRPSGVLRAAARRRRPAPAARTPGGNAAPAPAELGWIDGVLDPDVLTIGFARRVPSYKRLTLMLRDPDRLMRAAARTPSGRSRSSSPARRTRPTTAARG